MKYAVLIAIALAATLSAAAAQSTCPIGWYPVGINQCCPNGTIPVMGPFGNMQCQRM